MVLGDHRPEGGVGARVVDENVDAAEPVEGQLDAAPSLVLLHRVRTDTDGSPGNHRGGRVSGFLLPGGQHDVRASGGEGLRGRQADAP